MKVGLVHHSFTGSSAHTAEKAQEQVGYKRRCEKGQSSSMGVSWLVATSTSVGQKTNDKKGDIVPTSSRYLMQRSFSASACRLDSKPTNVHSSPFK